MTQKRSGKRADPEIALKRRLSSYPNEMWAILTEVIAGRVYRKEFPFHNYATAFSARFYRFRMDAIEGHVDGALALRDVRISGTDAKGNAFRTNEKGEAPYLLQWNLDSLGGLLVQEHKPIEEKAKEEDPFEKMLREQGYKLPELTTEEIKDPFKQMICKHEIDATGTRCIHCGRPMETGGGT